MNENEFDRTARAWLDDGPTRMSDRAVLSALEEIHTTRQRRAWWPARRATPVNFFARAAIAAVLVVGVGLVAINVLPRGLDGPAVGGPSPSPSPAQAVDFPDLTTTFVSPRNGFSIKHPEGVALTPAKQLWGFSEQVDDGFDVVETGLAAVFKGASDRGSGMGPRSMNGSTSSSRTIIACLAAAVFLAASRRRSPSMGSRAGSRSVRTGSRQPSSPAGGSISSPCCTTRSDARAVFDAFAATIDLTPETAIDFPGLTTTFVSPTYGFSFGYIRGITPATELWDPGNQPLDDGNLDNRFDGVETGLGAYLEGASTPIPDGISIDEWVDQYVTPLAAGGCGVPRSQQAEITIDGQSGRISECANQIEATVVAGGRLYLFTLYRDSRDARAMFDAWVATIDLTPETAAVPDSGNRLSTTSPSEAQ